MIIYDVIFFLSSDGMCLHESKFCDGQMDCVDKTDELFCNLVKIYFNQVVSAS